MEERTGPLVSITIPTLNSAKTLARALQSVHAQTYRSIETIVIDGNSSDNSAEIAHEAGAKTILTSERLLAARILGIQQARGDFILLMDSDQTLETTTVSRALELSSSFDMICLGETTAYPDRFVPGLLELSRKVVQANRGRYMNPLSGVMLPRFFKSGILRDAAARVPPEVRHFVSDRDHQILYWEASCISESIGFLNHAVRHSDPTNLVEVWRKAEHWGEGAGTLFASGYYRDLVEARYTLRVLPDSSENDQIGIRNRLGANIIAIFKGVPYEIGFRIGQLRGHGRAHL